MALIFPPVAPAASGDDLPDIGSPGNSVLSRETELQIGRAIFRSLADTGRVMGDPEIQEYVQDVGMKLASQAQDGDFRFRFFVVNDPAINAFALPGGYVGVHSGLLLSTSSESELAGVLAHEIAHVTQRHISRAVFANQRSSILTMAAMLGAIPLAIGFGYGAELRRPLGISIVGGLLVSQLLTLYTTPVVYLYLDRFRLWARRKLGRSMPAQPALAD